jgi:hydroxybutyrate-dimer hydrolase
VAPAATGAAGNNIAISFATGNGTSNAVPANIVYNNSVGGASAWTVAVSPSTGVADFGFDNALCQRALVTGVDAVTGAPLSAATTPTAAQSAAVRAGMAETTVSGNLRGKPTLIVAGRSDALIPINHNSRAYAAYNRTVEGSASKLRYVEVTNAQHFDAFLGLSGYSNRYVPLHLYFVRAMDAMYAHLKSGTALPPSQVVRTTARGGAAATPNPLRAENVPTFNSTPAAGNEIAFGSTTVAVPN